MEMETLPLLLALYALPIVLGLCHFGSSTTPLVEFWDKALVAPRHLEPLLIESQHVIRYPHDWQDPPNLVCGIGTGL